MSNSFKLILMVFLILLIFIGGPFLTLWVLNTLFGMGLPYSFINWLAALCLSSILGATKVNLK